MSIATRQRMLARRRAVVFRGIGEKMYGRLERASATGSPFSGSAATRRSYLAHHLDHGVGPVLERVLGDDPAPQFGADLSASLRRRGDDRPQRRGEGTGIAWRRDELQRQSGEER